ncbi:MAG: hypothetical protein ACRC7W_02475 [Fusobacteriaceae bacterium]
MKDIPEIVFVSREDIIREEKRLNGNFKPYKDRVQFLMQDLERDTSELEALAKSSKNRLDYISDNFIPYK